MLSHLFILHREKYNHVPFELISALYRTKTGLIALLTPETLNQNKSQKALSFYNNLCFVAAMKDVKIF